MTRDEIKAAVLRHASELTRIGVTGVYVFGSRARGDNKPDSDVDLFVDYSPAQKVPSYFNLLELKLRLEEQLGLPVHLGTRPSLASYIRAEAEKDAVRLY